MCTVPYSELIFVQRYHVQYHKCTLFQQIYLILWRPNPGAPSANISRSDVSEQASKPPQPKHNHIFDPSAPPLLQQVQERTQQYNPTEVELIGTDAKYKQAWYEALVNFWTQDGAWVWLRAWGIVKNPAWGCSLDLGGGGSNNQSWREKRQTVTDVNARGTFGLRPWWRQRPLWWGGDGRRLSGSTSTVGKEMARWPKTGAKR